MNVVGRRELLHLGVATAGVSLLGCGLIPERGAEAFSISDEEVEQLVRIMDEDRQRWIDGRYDPEARGAMEQAPDMTLFGPFGGPSVKAGPDGSQKQRLANAAFKGGTGACEVVSVYREGNLVVLVMIERNEVLFAGHDEPHPWELRTTQVFRREGARWIRLHRHADPLTQRRNLDQTLELLEPM